MRSIPRVSCYTTPHHAPRPCRERESSPRPSDITTRQAQPGGMRHCQLFASLHFQCQCIASFASLFWMPSRCGLSLSTNVAFTALHAQHVAFLAHLERISPFPGPAQAQGYIDMPCYGGGFSFYFFFFISCWTTKPVWIQLSLVIGRIRQLLFM